MSSAAVTGKRKRGCGRELPQKRGPTTLQLVTGSYERVLHGLTVQIPVGAPGSPDYGSDVVFEDNFLFTAHASSIRSVAVSPPSTPKQHQASKRILATGSTDERINLYQISCSASSMPPNPSSTSLIPRTNASGAVGSSTFKNRELGSLLHHSSAVTTLDFPSRNKLLSASSDNSIAITRVRDWTVLSTIRAPIPKAVGRPSGDTSAVGDVPAGIIDVAVHPSAKLCVSIGHGERCMRLWNLVTGKKAGVLTFDKCALAQVGEGRWRAGEARRVVWNDSGEEFAVAFERGCLVYSLDCQIRAVVPVCSTKVCQVRYLPDETARSKEEDLAREEQNSSTKKTGRHRASILALSTEDGRVMFYDTSKTVQSAREPASTSSNGADAKHPPKLLPLAYPLAMLTPPDAPSEGRLPRVKDFHISRLEDRDSLIGDELVFCLATATSTGTIRICTFRLADLEPPGLVPAVVEGHDTAATSHSKKQNTASDVAGSSTRPALETDKASIAGNVPLVGTEIGVYETGNRIICMTGFVMDAAPAHTSVSRDSRSAVGQRSSGPGANTLPDGEDGEWGGLDGDELQGHVSPNLSGGSQEDQEECM